MGKYKFKGLTSEEVVASQTQHGKNELPPPEIESFWDKLKENFEDPLIRILCIALCITIFLAFLGYSNWLEGFGIGFAVFLATFVSTYSEYKNESSFQDLQLQASKVQNNIFRNGEIVSILVSEIVKGDYILLEAGDKAPADGPLIAGMLSASQASLNGEPEPVPKTVPPADYKPAKAELDDEHYIFRGSIMAEGDGVMIADKIGTETLYGGMMKDLKETEDRKSPLKVKLENLADGISTLAYVGAVFIFLSFLFKQFVMDQGYSFNNTLEYLKRWHAALQDTVTALILSIIIIVVAVPEGLPMMIAIVLSLNMKKLLDEKVLVRKLLGIETAGSLDILFTDKTGTITHGILEPHQFVSGALTDYNMAHQDNIPEALKKVLYFSIKHSTACHVDKSGNIMGGNSSDRAFLSIIPKDYLLLEDEVFRGEEVLFNSILKFSVSSITTQSKEVLDDFPKSLFHEGRVTVIKGAPEKILSNCTHFFNPKGQLHNITDVQPINDLVDTLSHSGIRVIALAVSHGPLDMTSISKTSTPPQNLCLVGLLGLRDEIRKESKGAIKLAKTAGIQVVMITGDKKETAISIAREVGLLPVTRNPKEDGSDKHLPRNSVLTSDEIHKMGDEELIAIMPEICVIARALPRDKSRLVKVCQKLNQVVGMTGDGVNDAAALSSADVGFAMGSGTEMAKEAADIVIMDDNFNSLTKAILYGRTIFRSIRKFIIFQSTINVASTLIVFLGPFLGFDFPLTLIQLLWVNLVMDTLAALAFGGEPALPRYMHDKPVRRDEAIVSPYMWSSFMLGGGFIAGLSILFLVNDVVLELFQRDGHANQDVFLTAFFAWYIFITTVNAFNVRTRKINIFENIFKNPGFILVLIVIFMVQMMFTYIGGTVLRTVPLKLDEWGIIIPACFLIIPFDIFRKICVAPWLPKRLIDTTGLVDEEEEKEKKKELVKENRRNSQQKPASPNKGNAVQQKKVK